MRFGSDVLQLGDGDAGVDRSISHFCMSDPVPGAIHRSVTPVHLHKLAGGSLRRLPH